MKTLMNTTTLLTDIANIIADVIEPIGAVNFFSGIAVLVFIFIVV